MKLQVRYGVFLDRVSIVYLNFEHTTCRYAEVIELISFSG